MRKLLFVIDSLGCGGAEKSLVSLLPLLNQLKYEIHLWILHRGGVFESLLPDHVIVEKEPQNQPWEQLLFRIGLVRYSLTFRWNKIMRKKEHGAETLWKCLRFLYPVPTQHYDVAIAYQQGLPTYLVATKVTAKKKIAWINVNIFNAGYCPDFNSQFYDVMDFMVPVSQELETILRERYPQYANKYICIYDILNPQLIRRYSEYPIKEYDLFSEQISLVTVGRLAVQKNYLLAVDTAKVLRNKGLKFRWFFVGEGSERAHIEQRIAQYGLEDTVVLLGMRTNPYPYIAQCSIYVQTSSFEGFGLTIAEAKILGKPVVSTNFDVVHNQIIHGQNGLIADMTADSLANQIIRMIEDKNLRNDIITNVNREQNTTYITEVAKVEKMIDAN